MGQQQKDLNRNERNRPGRTVDEDLAYEGGQRRSGGKGKGAENDSETAGRDPSDGKNGSAGHVAG